MTEIYKAIEGYEGRYEVSNLGNVRTLFGRVNKLTEPKIMNPEIFHKPYTSYARVQLSNPRKRFLVHRLVATAFIANLEDKPQVNHIDNNGLNNSIENLEWVTGSENLLHAQRQGRLTTAQSSGGVSQGIKTTKEAIESAEALVGNIYGNWKVIESLGLKSVGTKNIKRVQLMCVCIGCNNLYKVDRFQLTNGKAKVCRVCN